MGIGPKSTAPIIKPSIQITNPSIGTSKTRNATAWLRQFRHAEDGAMTIFACFMILIMLMVGGIGVDLMRNEMERTRLQAAEDFLRSGRPAHKAVSERCRRPSAANPRPGGYL